jgi:hypothetical protein
MKIDRHNYEEYFLLYIDNELNIDQKGQVEQFVKENPDLEEELVMFQQSKLIPDTSIVFDKKELLMKDGNDSLINLNNYEEFLVLYVDNELNQEEKLVVEKFAAAHAHVQQELELFQQTKLQPEEIVFANKEVLYKKEKVAVISMQWWRVAAAAVLIIAGGITLYSVLYNRNNTIETPGTITKAETKKEQSPAKSILSNQQEQINDADKKIKENLATTETAKKQSTDKKEYVKPNKPAEKPNQQLAINSPVSEKNNSEVRELAMTEINKERIDQSNISSAGINNDELKKDLFNKPSVTNSPNQTLDNSDASNNDVIYASNTDRNENKRLRGFFRKATRFIEHTTNINPADDDNKVLIGGMAINLK